ncbi:Ring_finger_domain/Zinc_finger [Leishmania braziliensis MHOM/BR/75/M2904]|uniref:Ring_finger_domain/Zinc_finger n=1 Tax=Leishmania braziliensis MHOM/BR/75/M2904 TaxID=420245 RepID=A0A3P3Z999_LEIBR|nr:Ring_finger_domain/Zinc_finger [Leishmania braziliensis MHOM/BR/75/M2904]
MVRHERNQDVRRELQLTPAHYQVHYAALTVDEMHLYDRVALVIMSVATRLHRQGVLSSRMGYAMQWVQELCRLCLHPSRVGNDELLRGDIEAHVLRGVRLMSDDRVCGINITEVLADSFVAATPQEALEWVTSMAAARKPGLLRNSSIPEETATTLAEIAQVPPLLPQCGICMDNMAAPTLLKCLHMFCKECVLGVIDASRSVMGNVNAKCPYCRDRKSMMEEKRVVMVDTTVPMKVVAETRHNDKSSTTAAAHSGDEDVNVVLARIGDGSRVRAFLEVVEEIWRTQPDDGVLVFSKYPAFLQLAYDAVAARGYAPHMVCGASSLAQRQRAMRAMQSSSGDSALSQRRILFVTSRSANAGLNLTFANHVVFLEPNLNPAIEHQAVGRVHRFGQLKQSLCTTSLHLTPSRRSSTDGLFGCANKRRRGSKAQPQQRLARAQGILMRCRGERSSAALHQQRYCYCSSILCLRRLRSRRRVHSYVLDSVVSLLYLLLLGTQLS